MEWIDAKEKLPPLGVQVLTFRPTYPFNDTDGKVSQECVYLIEISYLEEIMEDPKKKHKKLERLWWKKIDEDLVNNEITHWSFLPAPPKVYL